MTEAFVGQGEAAQERPFPADGGGGHLVAGGQERRDGQVVGAFEPQLPGPGDAAEPLRHQHGAAPLGEERVVVVRARRQDASGEVMGRAACLQVCSGVTGAVQSATRRTFRPS
jgi:hypothetical protein